MKSDDLAFPLKAKGLYEIWSEGITIRQYISIEAMKALIPLGKSASFVASESVRYADALIVELDSAKD